MIAKTTKLLKTPVALSSATKKISRDALNLIITGSAHHVAGNRLVRLGQLDVLRVLAQISPKNASERLAKAALLRACYKAEQQHALGSIAVLLGIVGSEFVDFDLYNQETLHNIAELSDCADLGHHLLQAINLGGAQAIMGIKTTDRDSFTLVSDSIDVPITGVAEFGSDIHLSNCRVVSFDGVIERVSEINILLESSIASDGPLVLYARGYGYEVISTLLHNWRCKRLRVIPLTPSNDIQNFWFADLPTVTSNDSTSEQVPKWDNLLSLESVKITNGIMSIQDSVAREKAASRRVVISREGQDIGINRSLVDERVGRLTSRKVEIQLGNDLGDASGIVKDRFDALLRVHMHSRGDFMVTRKFAGTSFTLPAKSDIVGQQSASSLVRELETSVMVVQDV